MSLPGAIACHFGKTVLLDPEREESFREACDAWGSRSLLSCPLRRDRDIVGALVFGKKNSHPFTNVQVKLLWALAMQAQNHLQRNESINEKSVYSFLEPLTHLYNRPYFNNQLEKEILRSRRSGESFSLLMLDIDGFREYKDRVPSASGEIALQEFAGILGGVVREVDTVAHLGGSRFAVILLESDTEGAISTGEPDHPAVPPAPSPRLDGSRTERLNGSIGIASFPADSFDFADLLSKTERALYAAREQGGGRACPYHEIAGNGLSKPGGKELPVNKIFDAGRSVVDMDKFLEILLFTAMQGLGAGRGSIVVKDPGGEFTLTAAIGFDRYEEHHTAAGRFHPGLVTTLGFGPSTSPRRFPAGRFPLRAPPHEERVPDRVVPVPSPDASRADPRSAPPDEPDGPAALHLGRPENLRADHVGDRDDPCAGDWHSTENVRSFSLSILSSVSGALELRFPFLSGHADRVRDLSVRIGRTDGSREWGPRPASARGGAARRRDRRNTGRHPCEDRKPERGRDGVGPEAPVPRLEDAGRRPGNGCRPPDDPRTP